MPSASSCIPDYLKSLQPYFTFVTQEVCLKDSRNITNEDRKKLCSIIEESEDSLVLITHGTYTMPDTARYLEAHLGKIEKTIILTGSMFPMAGFSPSDAGFNLGFAIAHLSLIPHGVFIAMNGRIFQPNEVMKTLNE